MSGNLVTVINLSVTVFALLLVFVLPGFTLSYFLLPKNDFNLLERFFITITASIAISSILGFVIIIIKGNLQAGVLFYSLLIMSIFFTIGSFFRKKRNEANESLFDNWEIFKSKTIFYFLTYLFILVCLSSIVVRSPVELENISAHITEFYIDPNYIEDLIQGDFQKDGKVKIPLVVVNHEGEPTNYEIDFVQDGIAILNYPKILLTDGAKWEKVLTVPINETGPNGKLDIFLYKENGERIAHLRLWLEQ
jgi:uncharacterized membrane protein